MLSVRCSGLLVAGITAVTAGWARIHLRKNWPQLWQSISAAHGGSARPRTRRALLEHPRYYEYRQELLTFLEDFEHGAHGRTAARAAAA